MPRYPVLTQLAVDRLKPRGRRYELPDGPGGVPAFAVRVGETGCKSFVLGIGSAAASAGSRSVAPRC
jgi:hypothetical protein